MTDTQDKRGRGRPSRCGLSPDMLDGLRARPVSLRESKWCALAMERQEDWLPTLGKGPFDKYELEVQVRIDGRWRWLIGWCGLAIYGLGRASRMRA